MVVLDEQCVYEKNVSDTPAIIIGFRRVHFSDKFDLLVHDIDGFFNATELCVMRSKKLIHFQEGKRFKDLEQLLLTRLEFGDPVRYTNCDLGYTDQSAVGGTYYHPILFLALALWCGEEFYVKAAILVNGFFNRSVERRALLDRTFALKTTVINEHCAYSITPLQTLIVPIDSELSQSQLLTLQIPTTYESSRVMHAGFELLVDDHKWFNASKFCYKYADQQKRLQYFSKTNSFPRLVEHIRQNLQLDPVRDCSDAVDGESIEYGTFYHPLLFLALASWISLEFYVKTAHIVFAYFSSYDHDESMKMLALGERPGDTTSVLPTDIVVEPTPSTSTYFAKSPTVCEPEIIIKPTPLESVNFSTISPIVHESDTTTINTPTYDPNTTPMTPESKLPSSVTWIDESSSSTFASTISDRDEEMFMETNYTEAEIEFVRKEWQLRLDHMERQHQLKLKETRYKLNQRLSQKEYEEQTLREKLKNKEIDDNELRKQLATIETESRQRECELLQRLERNKAKARQLRTQLAQKEAEIEKSNRENEQRLEQMRSRQEREVEQKRREDVELASRLKAAESEKITYFLRSTEQRRQVDELTQQLEQMRLSNERLRMTTLKRNPVAEKQNCIREVYQAKFGMDRLEMLVVTSIAGPGQQFYGFRRKLNGAFYAINKRMQVAKGERVMLWFVSNNAKQDFIDCKSYLFDKAYKTGVELQTRSNTIGIGESTNIEKFDTICLLRDFGRLAGMMELDAGYMQTLLELAQNQYTSTDELNGEDITEVLLRNAETQSNQMFIDIYKYILNDYKKSFT